MKHRLALPAILMAGALSLAACAAQPAEDPSASATAAVTDVASDAVDVNAALAAMTWTDNGEGVAPTIGFEAPINFDAAGAILVEDGDGAELSDGQMLMLDYVQISGTDGTPSYATYDTGTSEPVELSTSYLEETLFNTLVGAHVGARVLWAVPDQGAGSTIIALTVADVIDVLDRAEGTAVAPVDGLPVITLDADGVPSVDFSGATMPTELVSQDLITGTGAVVEEDQALTVNYTGWVWDGDQFDSSWANGAPATFTLSQGSLIDGWVQGLAGKTVGSQVLLVIPPELGYGDADQGTIPAGSTLVFVVDILAAY